MDKFWKATAAVLLALSNPPQSSKDYVPPPNPKAERRKMLKVRDMQARKNRKNSRWRIL